MTEKGCLLEIHARLPSLSGKERKIADFILANPREAVNPTMEELAEKVGVSEATLFRFVRKLGYGGYQQFRIALATETIDPWESVYESADPGSDEETTIDTVFRTDIAALERSRAAIDPTLVARTAALVASAPRVLLLGLGGSVVVALDAYHRFLRTGIDCSAPLDFHLQLMAASQLSPGDLALVFSHTGANKDAIALAEAVRGSGATLVVVTDSPRSPLSRLADLLIAVRAGTTGPAAESYSARVVQMALVDAIYVDAMRLLGDKGVAALARMRATIAKRRL
jgi:RpiR family transcriptional regulator, carbohydrate utilization regulator